MRTEGWRAKRAKNRMERGRGAKVERKKRALGAKDKGGNMLVMKEVCWE